MTKERIDKLLHKEAQIWCEARQNIVLSLAGLK